MASLGNTGAVINVTGFGTEPALAVLPDNELVILGAAANLAALSFAGQIGVRTGTHIAETTWKSAIDQVKSDLSGSSFLSGTKATAVPVYLKKAHVVSPPSKHTRINSSSGNVALFKCLKGLGLGKSKSTTFLLAVDREHVLATVGTIAKLFPMFDMKTSKKKSAEPKNVTIEIIPVGGQVYSPDDFHWLSRVTECVRGAARIVDVPANIMTTTAFVEEAKEIAAQLPGVQCTVVSGEDLRDQGFGAIYSVGMASLHPPAMVVLSHKPAGAEKTIAWVGKGIVFDTGGMQIKGKTTMPGMKRDCGGAAAVLHAFRAAVLGQFSQNLHAVLCIAENMISQHAMRPDDIITMLSGKTVEVNNTDAEGRLVLGDGVYHAWKTLGADVILDMATLTGAQRNATGDYHGAVLTNNAEWEQRAIAAGLVSGDMVHPIPYCPELHYPDMSSVMADMKNSLVGRAATASSSIAGLFIHAQLEFDANVPWIHVDMAQPVEIGERATGYGVALMLTLFGRWLALDFGFPSIE